MNYVVIIAKLNVGIKINKCKNYLEMYNHVSRKDGTHGTSRYLKVQNPSDLQ
jgi:hypothetical protein